MENKNKGCGKPLKIAIDTTVSCGYRPNIEFNERMLCPKCKEIIKENGK